MLRIDTEAVIGLGSHRICYQHPKDENLCIKIEYVPNTKASIREKKYYALLNKRDYTWDLVPKYYGSEPTNLGIGEVFDLVKDYDGKVSKTLSHYLKRPQIAGSRLFIQGFFEFKSRLFADALITNKLHPNNIVVRNDRGGFTFLIIDDLGNSEFLPVSNFVNYFASRKVSRKWARFERLLSEKFSNVSLIEQLIGVDAYTNRWSNVAVR